MDPSALDPTLASLWQRCLPPTWRVHDVRRGASGWRASCLDAQNASHDFAIARASGDGPSMARGEQLALSHRGAAAGNDAEQYRAIFAKLLAHETELLALLERLPPARRETRGDAPGGSSRDVVMAREHALALELASLRLAHGTLERAADAWARRRNASGEVMVYFETRCKQACEYCVEPTSRTSPTTRVLTVLRSGQDRIGLSLVRSGAWAALLAACERRGIDVTITGHDWLQHPDRDEILAQLEARPAVRKRILSPSTEFADEALATRVGRLHSLEVVSLSLQSCIPAVHDACTGAPGSGIAVQLAVANLQRAGIHVQLTMVLVRRALGTLEATLQWASVRGLAMTLVALTADRGHPAPEALQPSLAEIRDVLANLSIEARSGLEALKGVPLCAIPTGLGVPVLRSHVSPEREDVRFARACARCSLRPDCSGLTASYTRAWGEGELRPVA